MSNDGIRWQAAVRVEKYSPDQAQWAARESGIAEPK